MVQESAESRQALQDEEIPGILVRRIVKAFQMVPFCMEQNSHLRKNPEVAAAEGFEPALSLTNQEFDTSHSSTSCASLSFFGNLNPAVFASNSFIQFASVKPFWCTFGVFRALPVICSFGSPQRSQLKGRGPSKTSQFTLSYYLIQSLSWSVGCLQWS